MPDDSADTQQQFHSPSMAHSQSSSFATIDPIYSSTVLTPPSDFQLLPSKNNNSSSPCWLYGEAELECYRLHVLKTRTKEAKLNVWYPGIFHIPYTKVQFRFEIHLENDETEENFSDEINMRAVGNVRVYLNGKDVYCKECSDEIHCFHVDIPTRNNEKNLTVDLNSNYEERSNVLMVTIETQEKDCEPPALLIENGYFATTYDGKWQWRNLEGDKTWQLMIKDEDKEKNGKDLAIEMTTAQGNWSTPMPFPKTITGLPPHKVEIPSIVIKPDVIHPPDKAIDSDSKDQLFDFGRELLGYVIFSCSSNGGDVSPPFLYVGESIAEAMADDLSTEEFVEQSTELVVKRQSNECEDHGDDDIQWSSKHLLAFRYIRIVSSQHTQTNDVSCHALFHPVQYRGAFACSKDNLLTQIWMHSAYTLRLCMHHFIIDGIKRDRLPWTGDLALSIMVNAYTFADGEIVRQTLIALSRAGILESDINGIVDYSLWWIISEDLYQVYFSDITHLSRQWPRIKKAMESLQIRCDGEGMLCVDEENDWLFIDWVVGEGKNKLTAMQILWWWAQVSASALADRMADGTNAKLWQDAAKSLANVLYSRAWDSGLGAWQAHPSNDDNGTKEISRHANLLAIVSGLTESNVNGIKSVLLSNDIPPVGTPYMKAFECLALSYLGETQESIDHIRTYWGGMLDQGATTFWEAYDKEEKNTQVYSFYDRPFGKSLCHAWGSGPAMLLPFSLMGIRPISDGWKRFTVSCNVAGLTSACASVPTPYGNINVEVDGNKVVIYVPSGTILKYNKCSYSGPVVVSRDIDDV